MLLIEDSLFYCTNITSDDAKDIKSFAVSPKNCEGLAHYLKYEALLDESSNKMRTYLVRDNYSHELVAFFSLKAGLISTESNDEETESFINTFPGIELANFAVNYSYVVNHPDLKGLGLVVFNDFVLYIVDVISNLIGARVLYIFSLPDDNLINHYKKKYEFMRLDIEQEKKLHRRIKNDYDEECIFMYRFIKYL